MGCMMLASAGFWGDLRKLLIMVEGKRGAALQIEKGREREREKSEVLHTFKQPDLMIIYSLSQEQQQENGAKPSMRNLPPGSNHLPSGPISNTGDYNST